MKDKIKIQLPGEDIYPCLNTYITTIAVFDYDEMKFSTDKKQLYNRSELSHITIIVAVQCYPYYPCTYFPMCIYLKRVRNRAQLERMQIIRSLSTLKPWNWFRLILLE